MINANEAKERAFKAIQKANEARKEKAKHIVETQIACAIAKACNEGSLNTKIHIDASVDKDVVVNLLKDNGYTVNVHGYTISISWYI